MHRLAATPGGWDHTSEGVVFIDQTPAPIVLLSAADTDISALWQALGHLPKDFSDIRSVNLLQLQQQLTIDTYAEDILSQAKLIIVRVLGGRAYWPYGLEVVKEVAEQTGAALVIMPGDTSPDLDLMGHSTVPLAVVNQLWQYFCEGGVANLCNGLMYASDRTLSTQYAPPAPLQIPRIGHYEAATKFSEKEVNPSLKIDFPQDKKNAKTTNLRPAIDSKLENNQSLNLGSKAKAFCTPKTHRAVLKNNALRNPLDEHISKANAAIGILFYRAHYLAGNTKVIDALCEALLHKGLTPMPIYVSSLKDIEIQQQLLRSCKSSRNSPIELLINTTSFAINPINPSVSSEPDAKELNTQKTPPPFNFWQALDVPVLQAICSGSPREYWQGHPQGLTPRDIAMNVALPEIDGRIITRAVSFKTSQAACAQSTQSPCQTTGLQTDVVMYEPKGDRIEFVANLAARWIHLRRTPPQARKIALILANYPNRDGRMANGVGLDTPASCLNILQALQREGYDVGTLPENGDALMAQLAQGITNDPEGYGLRPANQTLEMASYRTFFEALPSAVQQGITQRWGSAADEWQRFTPTTATSVPAELPIPGIQFGNIFVGIQPSRGYDIDPTLNYHAPDLEPTHAYLGFYHWLREHFGAHAMVHVGKHGNLEWLPGKGIALSQSCYPEAAFGPMPHFYPFIVNDPGEGAQAKRRSQAVILDHLTPPMTRAELYGPLQQLESLVDEYYEAQNLDPTRLKVISPKIVNLLKSTQLQQDLSLSLTQDTVTKSPDLQTWLPQIDGYLCELKEAQIRDGLHIYGQCPENTQLRDLIVAIARHPNSQHIGLSRAIAQLWNLDIDPLTANLAEQYTGDHPQLAQCRTIGDVVERIEHQANEWVATVLSKHSTQPQTQPEGAAVLTPLQNVLNWICNTLLPNLQQTPDEINNLLHSGLVVANGRTLFEYLPRVDFGLPV
ncbi:MAG: cobaltochelatase subunit CobN, partial [Cyanobacteria bacterium J06598_3]